MPVAFQDVNFIPDDVVKTRKVRKQSKAGIKFGIIVSLIAIILAGGILIFNQYNSKKTDQLAAQVESQQARVQELKQFGEKGFILGYRLDAIQKIFNDRIYYSKLIEELENQTPSTITVSSWRLSGDKVALSASSYPNYTPIASFQENLRYAESGMFTDLQLKSASLKPSEGSVGFSMSVDVDMETLKEPLEGNNNE